MIDAVIGVALFTCALVMLAGLTVFVVACRLAGGDCWPGRTGRRIAAWRRAGPWVAVVCAAVALTGLWLRF